MLEKQSHNRHSADTMRLPVSPRLRETLAGGYLIEHFFLRHDDFRHTQLPTDYFPQFLSGKLCHSHIADTYELRSRKGKTTRPH